MTQSIHRYLVALSVFVLTVTALVVPSGAGAQSNRLCFNVPGITHCIEGRFRQYWEQNGGLAVFGYPISAANYEQSRESGITYLTQHFERNTFELHPNNGRPYDVLLGRLGAYRLLQLNRNWPDEPKAPGPVPGCTWVALTQHNICDQGQNLGFKSYLRTHGLNFDGKPGISPEESLALIGLPLTEARMETNHNGDTVLTQWFERARLEWHPQKPDQFKVLLGLLATEVRNHIPGYKTDCSTPVVNELRRHYEEVRVRPNNITLRQALGCLAYAEHDLPAAVQHFERGTMIWQAPTANRGYPHGLITVMFSDTNPLSYSSYADTWESGQPESGGEIAPAGRFEPRRGFGKVWREQLGVRQRLSWAMEPERQELSSSLIFEGGTIVWLKHSDLVYVFLYDSGEATYAVRIK